MSNSKFLPFQDANGDGLNDACKEEFVVTESKVCPECTPNPNAIVPNWVPRNNFSPFLNEKICKYQVTYTTPESTTGFVSGMSNVQADEALQSIYEKYSDQAVNILLLYYNKESTEGSRALLKESLEFTDYDLDPRPGSRLKLLYSIPFEILNAIEESTSEEEEPPSPVEVTFVAEEIGPMLLKIRKTLNLYNRYLNAYRFTDNKNLYFRSEQRIFDLKNYGDYGFGSSVMRELGEQLSDFMRSNGYNIKNLGSLAKEIKSTRLSFSGSDTVTEITFGFTASYRLQKIVFYTEGCGTKPIVFAEKCEQLRQSSAWKDPTAVAYFASLMDMDTIITAREAPAWLDVLLEYTYPEIYATDPIETPNSSISCVAGALAEEGKQLGQDVLDEVLGLGDAIAAKFHDALCKTSNTDLLEERERLYIEQAKRRLGNSSLSDEDIECFLREYDQDFTPENLTKEGAKLINNDLTSYFNELLTEDDEFLKQIEARGNVTAMALEQAFKELDASNTPFDSFCAAILQRLGIDGESDFGERLSCIAGGDSPNNNATTQTLDIMFEGFFDRIRKCGLFDFFMDGITCLFNGLTLEEAVASMIEAAFNGMSIKNFGDLFIGLPTDKQEEIDALVRKKLSEGDVFPDDSGAQEYSDNIADTTETETYEYPWTGVRGLEGAENLTFKDYTAAYFNVSQQEDSSAQQKDTRTLAQQYDNAASDAPTATIMQAYFKAVLEVYSNDLLELVDLLSDFPGAPLLAQAFLLIDCPRPPFFQPSIAEFIKDIDLPFCRDVDPLVFPRFNNPFGALPKIKDILRLLFEAIKCEVQLAILKILTKLIVKLCELLGSAICNALGTVGDIVGSLPDLISGRDNIRNVIRDSICGSDADQQQVDDTIVDMLAQMGVGGQAFADTETSIAFMEDLSGALTYNELLQLMNGEPTSSALDIIDTIIEYEYPQYRESIPNRASAGRFFENMGNLLPASFRKSMRDALNRIPVGDITPANPSLCLDPEKLQAFKDLRCELLEGRASAEQCKEMFCNMRDRMTGDLGDLAPLTDVDNIQDYLASQLPPLVSDPGCENGIIPYEPQESVATITATLSGDIEQLKVDYAVDMLGNGPISSDWGLLNMMLSDTMGAPLSTHIRKVSNQDRYVDFYSNYDPTDLIDGGLMGNDPFIALELADKSVVRQRGAFPTKVGVYLQRTMDEMGNNIAVNLNNIPQDDIDNTVDLNDLGFSNGRDLNIKTAAIATAAGAALTVASAGYYAGIAAAGAATGISVAGAISPFNSIDILELPDFGYNYDILPNVGEGGNVVSVSFVENARKAQADLALSFEDNARGLKAKYTENRESESDYAYGFDIGAYFSDLYKNENGDIVNIKSDNMRVKIIERQNQNANDDASKNLIAGPLISGIENGKVSDDAKEERFKFWNRGSDITENKTFEFMSVDDTLQSLTPDRMPIEEYLSEYPEFLECFEVSKEHMPQTYLLKNIIENNTASVISIENVSSFQANGLNNFMSQIMKDIADMEAPVEETAWNYGAQYDNLTMEDLQYGINDNGTWVPYSEANDGEQYTNEDMVLGISYDQYKNEIDNTPENTRVFYLDPAQFGGNYVRPPLYIKPLKQVGWLGLVDAFFPDPAICKPQTTDMVDFGEIQSFIDEIYPNIPEDVRLQSDSECAVEMPYNRILDRSAKAGMMGLIKASIRIFVSSHFVKSIPTFSKFAPKFPQVFSSAYASYIVEDMKQSFLDSPLVFGELFSSFNDKEFWYGFLEQCVQSYSYLVDIGKIDPPATVVEALIRLNDAQEEYEYPFMEDFKEAERLGETKASIFNEIGLKRYREEKNFQAIKLTEEDAKLVMKEMVIEELNYMARIFSLNFKKLNIAPKIKDISYYVLESFTNGTSLTLNEVLMPNGSFKLTYANLPTVPWEDNPDAGDDYYYTEGGEFVVDADNDGSGLSVGQEYVGYYHVHIDEETNEIIYMAGEVHTENLHDTLMPINNITTVQIGDVSSYGDAISISEDKPFVIEKYIKIKNELYSPDRAVEIINSNSDLEKLISDVYPGNMKLVLNEGSPVGIEGELGVRYGLLFSVVVNGQKHELARTEIDALDVSLKDFANLTGNSKLLLCLINNLKEDKNFKLLTRYILPLPKLLSIAAIYNDMAILPSIGEVTVGRGEAFAFSGINYDISKKPGSQVTVLTKQVENFDGETITAVDKVEIGPMSQKNTIGSFTSVLTAPDLETGEETTIQTDVTIDTVQTISAPDGYEGAWAHVDDRNPLFTLAYKNWDEWDHVVLKNSTKRIKKLFKSYYYSRDYDEGKTLKEFLDELGILPGSAAFKRLKDVLKPSPASRLIPWWMRGRLRTNPFNVNDELCENTER